MSEPGTLVLFALMTAWVLAWVSLMAWTAREPAVRPQRSTRGEHLDDHRAWWAREHFVEDAWRRTDESPRSHG